MCEQEEDGERAGVHQVRQEDAGDAEAPGRQASGEGDLQHLDAAGAGPHSGLRPLIRRPDRVRGLQRDPDREVWGSGSLAGGRS